MSGAQLHPTDARPITLHLPSTTIAGLRGGEHGAVDVVLVPGYTGSKEDFAPILDPLADLGFRVTAVDLPGQLDSPGFADPVDYTPHRLAGVLVELAEALGGHVRLVGHSFGGLVARAAAIAAPTAFVDVVLMSSGPGRIDGARRARIEALGPVLPDLGIGGVWAAMQDLVATEAGYVPPSRQLAAFLERRFLAGHPAMLKGMADALLVEPDRVEELRATGLPLLVLHGSDDDAWPPSVQQDMAARLGARYEVLPGAAHSPAVENPAATVTALVDFWRGRAARR